MTDRQREPQQFLESLLSPDEPQPAVLTNGRPPEDEAEDVDTLVDDLEALLTEARRMPFGEAAPSASRAQSRTARRGTPHPGWALRGI